MSSSSTNYLSSIHNLYVVFNKFCIFTQFQATFFIYLTIITNLLFIKLFNRKENKQEKNECDIFHDSLLISIYM